MKILIISEYLHPQISGISVRIEYYVKYLRELGHHVNVYGPRKCPTANRKLFSVPFYLINTDIRLCLPSFQLYSDILFGKYDMVHIVGPNMLLCTILLYLLCKLMGINVCTSYHTNLLDFTKGYIKNPIVQKLALCCTIYFHYYPTIWLKIPILHPENYTDLKIACNNYNQGYVLSSGVDTKLLQYSPKFIKNKLIYVGRIAPEKNLFRLLDLFTLVQNEYTLDIVGFGPSENLLKRYVKEKQIKNVCFIGRIDYDNLYRYYQVAQAFICTSLNESYGFTLLESMSCGTPIIYPKCAVFDKLYKPNFPQLEYHIENDQEFLNVLTYIQHNGEYLRQSCRTHANQYSWRKSTEDLVSIYKTIMIEHK
jgi:1,2-diacylglycerol 3-alpha-glucosyltransferase